RFPTRAPLLTSSSALGMEISPNGERLLIRRRLPNLRAADGEDNAVSLMSFAGGPETPLPTPSGLRGLTWADSTSVSLGTQIPGGLRLSVLDVGSGKDRNAMTLPDSVVRDAQPLADGWVWIPKTSDRIVISRGGTRREIPKPSWFGRLTSLRLS